MLLFNVLLLVIGFAALIKGADWFVEGSSSLAKNFKVPGLIIGLTIVAFGTSAPELAVSTTASLAGNNDIAVGNVIGSNIFNLLVVLGACGVVHTFRVRLRWDFIASIVAGAILFLMIFRDLFLSRTEAFILLGLFAVFMVLTVRDALINRVQAEEETKIMPLPRCVIYIVGGLAAIVCGGDRWLWTAPVRLP